LPGGYFACRTPDLSLWTWIGAAIGPVASGAVFLGLRLHLGSLLMSVIAYMKLRQNGIVSFPIKLAAFQASGGAHIVIPV